MKKIFLFFNDTYEKNIVLENINELEGCTSMCVFKPVNKILRLVRRAHIYSGLPGIGVWMLEWKHNLHEYDVCVCIASRYSPGILKWISKKCKNIKCINYYWDVVSISGYPVEQKLRFENWSFNREDCEKYGMIFCPQFYTDIVRLDKTEEVYDITYVGADRQGRLKERTQLICQFYKLFQSLKINSYIYYVTKSSQVPCEIRHLDSVSEEEYYRICSKGKAILELVENEIRWATLRPLLALSNGKKLVTNNIDIINEPFYNKENVFILGKDDPNRLKTFLKLDFVPYDNDVLEQFSIKQWCERFR